MCRSLELYISLSQLNDGSFFCNTVLIDRIKIAINLETVVNNIINNIILNSIANIVYFCYIFKNIYTKFTQRFLYFSHFN